MGTKNVGSLTALGSLFKKVKKRDVSCLVFFVVFIFFLCLFQVNCMVLFSFEVIMTVN